MQRLQIQLLRGLGRHELQRRALHGFGNPRPASLKSCFLSLAIGADIFGRHQTCIVNQAMRVAAQVMCAHAGFHARSDKGLYGKPRLHLGHATTFAAARWRQRRIVAHDVE